MPATSRNVPIPAPPGTAWFFDTHSSYRSLGLLVLGPADAKMSDLGLLYVPPKKRKAHRTQTGFVAPLASASIDRERQIRRTSKRLVKTYLEHQASKARARTTAARIGAQLEAVA